MQSPDAANSPAVNSRAWWEQYFKSTWDANGGEAQTRYFMETLIAHLPEPERDYLKRGSLKILDWGCAIGNGVVALSEAFPGNEVSGLDFSAGAIEEARIRHPGYEFMVTKDGEIPRPFDVIVTSNCLEHFEYPIVTMEKHLASCRDVYLVLVPYNEAPLHEQHRAQFRLESFPPRVGRFVRLVAEPIDVDHFYWPGRQVLVVYGSEAYLSERAGAGSDSAIEAARSYQSDFMAPFVVQLEAERLAQREKVAKLQREIRALEVEREAENDRRQMHARGLAAFRNQYERQLAAFRTQRAWQVMLAIRKAYTLFNRKDEDGILSCLKWIAESAAGKDPGLGPYELDFPNVLNYLPIDAFTAGPTPVAPLTRRETGAKPLYDVIVLPIFDFEFRFQRPQQIAVQFASAGHRVFWISPTRLLSGSDVCELVPLRDNVWEVRLHAERFDLYRGSLFSAQVTALLESLDCFYREAEIEASVSILQFPFWRQIGLALRDKYGTRIVYDCMDDWQNWPTEPMPGAFSLAEERKLAGEADVLVVTSRELHDRHAAAGVKSTLIPNAADFHFFHDASAGPPIADTPKPIVGYYGAIADWFDLELMTQVARMRPQYSFVFIGQVHMLDVSALKALPNTRLLGEKHYQELPAFLSQFDVCTLPFRMNKLTKAVDPVKVYEYLSQGKPVVSVPLPELAPLSDLLYFASSAGEFASQIDRALSEQNESRSQKRVEFASRNTWNERFEILDREIRRHFPLASILVVTYNTSEYLEPFLDSILRNTNYPCWEVIVVDNRSTDASPKILQRYASMDSRIRVKISERNLGFAGGNNEAARMAAGDYLVLLNPDTIVTSGWLEKLIHRLEQDPLTGMSAPVTNFSGNETKINTYYSSVKEMDRFAATRARSKRGESIEVPAIPLLCGAIKRSLWEQMGGLDETFEVGTFEDDDLSARLREAGYRLVTAEDCFIHHFGNGSFGKLNSVESVRIFERNRKRFEAKWKTTWQPHKTRPGVRPISEEPRIPLAEFLEEEGTGVV